MSEISTYAPEPSKDPFLKLMLGEKTNDLQENFPNAFLLLIQIAKTARRYSGGMDGLEVGDSIVGELQTSKKAGISRKEYRNSLKKLEELRFIEVVFNPVSKKVQKRAIKRASKSSIVNLLDSTVCNINSENGASKRATWGRAEGEELRKNKKEKEEDHHPYPSSSASPPNREDDSVTDDFSSSFEEGEGKGRNAKIIPLTQEEENPQTLPLQHNIYYQNSPQKSSRGRKSKNKIEYIPGQWLSQADIEACLALKGSHDAVKYAMEYVLRSPGRKFEIYDWPSTLEKWVIKSDIKPRLIENEEMGRRLEEEFGIYSKINSAWRCEVHCDRIKDQKGLLFYSVSGQGNNQEFVSYSDAEFKQKVSKLLRDKKMQKGHISQT